MPFDGDLWLHNLHVQVVRASEEKRNLIALLQPTSIDHRLYLTSISVQGDAPEGQVRGLSVQDGARVYAQGVLYGSLFVCSVLRVPFHHANASTRGVHEYASAGRCACPKSQ